MLQVRKNGHIKRECPKLKKWNIENRKGSSKSANVVREGDSESSDSDMLLALSSRII